MDRIEGFRLIDIQIFEDIITSSPGPACCEKRYMLKILQKRRALLANTYISVLCECGYAKENYTSGSYEIIGSQMKKVCNLLK